MPVRVAVPKETVPGENRVAMVPSVAERLAGMGVDLILERGAGARSHCPDDAYTSARSVDDPATLLGEADVVLTVQPLDSDRIDLLGEGTMLIGFMAPHQQTDRVTRLKERRVTGLAVELVPRIARAQAMDALSSQAAVAGYKAALIAADRSSRFFPMLTTAAGTIRPARVLVLGAGVAGLQAIATARRLGAIVEAYDVRKAVKEQVESLGARFVELELDAEAEGGYARELTPEEKAQEEQLVADRVAEADAVITTAAIPGKPAPRLISRAMVERMKPGSVVVDLAAETGGNCELTEPGGEVVHQGVAVHGPVNVPSMLPIHASEMYAKNLFNLLTLMIADDGSLKPDFEDEVIAGCMLTHEGRICHEPTRQLVEGGTP